MKNISGRNTLEGLGNTVNRMCSVQMDADERWAEWKWGRTGVGAASVGGTRDGLGEEIKLNCTTRSLSFSRTILLLIILFLGSIFTHTLSIHLLTYPPKFQFPGLLPLFSLFASSFILCNISPAFPWYYLCSNTSKRQIFISSWTLGLIFLHKPLKVH